MKILYPTGETWTDRSEHERQRVRGKERALLAVMGVWPDGRHQIIHYEAASDETADTGPLCQHLIERGLASAVRMLVSDGTKGLLEAMRIYLPQAQLQRCTVHKVRGFERYLKYENLPELIQRPGKPSPPNRHASNIVMPSNLKRWRSGPPHKPNSAWLISWLVEVYRTSRCPQLHLGHRPLLHLLSWTPSLHTLVRSTNAIERFFREFRNKADEIGAFPNEDSCLTLFHLVMVREHAKHNRVDFAKTG